MSSLALITASVLPPVAGACALLVMRIRRGSKAERWNRHSQRMYLRTLRDRRIRELLGFGRRARRLTYVPTPPTEDQSRAG